MSFFWITCLIIILLNKKTRILIAQIHSQNKADFIFCVLFFAFLLFPSFKIEKSDISAKENRTLAKFPQKIEWDFPKKIDSWFNDRFNGRSSFIDIFAFIKFLFLRAYELNGSFLDKDSGYIFENGENTYWMNPNNIENQNRIANNIKKYNNFCKENNIKCFIEMVPSKMLFFNKTSKLNDKYSNIFGVKYPTKGSDFVKYIYDNTGFNIIYPINEMMQINKKEMVYFKTDHHWTDVGTFIGYRAFIDELQKYYKTLTPLTLDDFNITYSNKVRAEIDRNFWSGTGCKLLRINRFICPLNVQYKFYDYKLNSDIKIDWDFETNQKTFTNPNAKNNHTVMIIGNSFTENFAPMLAGTFKKVYKIRSNSYHADNLDLNRWKDYIKNIKPDILIILAQDSYLEQHLNNLF